MSYEKYPGFFRVSEVADAAARLESDGLMYVGATWASQRSREILSEIQRTGTFPDLERFQDTYSGSGVMDYLASDWFANAIKAGATRKLQAAADRGTILNIVWDELTSGGSLSVQDAHEMVLNILESKAEECRLSKLEWKTGCDLGLIDKADKSLQPQRGYQCTLEEVAPFAGQLVRWFNAEGLFASESSQLFLVDDKRKVMGTCDDVGTWGDLKVVLDLKSSTSKQPKPYNRAQIAAYWRMLGAKADMRAMNLIVTPDGVYPRILSDDGLKKGLSDFDNALAILKNKSMKDSFNSSLKSAVTA